MKNRKLLLPAIILGVAILAIIISSVLSCIALKPAVTEEEFPYSITYELDGERVTINDVYKVSYVANDKDDNHKGRIYVGKRVSSGDEDTNYILKKEGNTRIELCTHFYPDYLMGDTEYDYFDFEPFEPRIYYYDAEEQEYYDEETLAEHGVKLISFEYPTPIENSLVFSHISYMTGESVFPILLISLLALILTLIAVKKEKELEYKKIDIVTIALNFIIGFTLIPFVTILAFLVDVTGGGPGLDYQITYFMPTIMILCTSASIALRRKGYGTKSLIAELVGPALFAIYLIVLCLCGLL